MRNVIYGEINQSIKRGEWKSDCTGLKNITSYSTGQHVQPLRWLMEHFPLLLSQVLHFFFFFFCEKWIYICCFLTCRENSIMPPFIIAAFRSSGLFEVLSGIKLMEHLTFLLCRHTLLSLLHRYILTHVASHDMLFGKRCARLSEQLATSQQKPIWANEILQDVSWGLWMRSTRLFNLHSSHLHD